MGLDLEKAAPNAQAEGDGAPEITDQMVSAGEVALLEELGGAVAAFWSPRDLAISVYQAMEAARRR